MLDYNDGSFGLEFVEDDETEILVDSTEEVPVIEIEPDTFSVDFSENSTFSFNMNSEENIDINVGEFASVSGGGGGTSDHRQLSYRNAPNQHTIGSITSLNDELGSRPKTVITDAEINAL